MTFIDDVLCCSRCTEPLEIVCPNGCVNSSVVARPARACDACVARGALNPTRFCECGAEIPKQRGQKFDSCKDCRTKAKAAAKLKCRCGNPRAKGAHHCVPCRDRIRLARKAPPPAKPCKGCQSDFTPTPAHRRYCDMCRAARAAPPPRPETVRESSSSLSPLPAIHCAGGCGAELVRRGPGRPRKWCDECSPTRSVKARAA